MDVPDVETSSFSLGSATRNWPLSDATSGVTIRSKFDTSPCSLKTISDVAPTALPLINSWLGATTITSATAGCDTETRFARSAKRKTIDLLTVTEIAGAGCACATAAGARTKNTENNATREINAPLNASLKFAMCPPVASELKFNYFFVLSVNDFDTICIARLKSRSSRPLSCGAWQP